jgi:UDP-N-acetylglucosamine diphosphorylase / glucose-1-phosphate thymidylyltransferase / UDP-N-acetylgalactosamine diphosphorylase / glucosamine-1-phosphate N-acetyltransferase / galactosamine-1-phosphate N-acetyltransferase
MQAVILAAGRGTRMKDLTNEVPKPMLEVAGKTLLEHKFDMLPESFDEIILIVGYLADVVERRFGSEYKGRKIRYVVQDTLDGTMGAVKRAEPFLKDRFLVLMGDDLYCREDVEKLVALPDWGILMERMESMGSGGNMVVADGKVVAIEEGDHRGKPGLMNTNMFMLDTRLFSYPPVPKSAGSDEYGLPQTVVAASKASGIALDPVYTTFWFQVTEPDDLPKAEVMLARSGR